MSNVEGSVWFVLWQNDLDRVVDQLHAASASQQCLQEQLNMIRADRDSLLEELKRPEIGLQTNRFCYTHFLVFIGENA